jgi:hypothetical protein
VFVFLSYTNAFWHRILGNQAFFQNLLLVNPPQIVDCIANIDIFVCHREFFRIYKGHHFCSWGILSIYPKDTT